jgi:hypothetical protein
LASEEVNLLAVSAVPFGPNHVELTIFPDQRKTFIQLSEKLGWKTTGPLHALLVQGDDHLGTLAEIQRMLLNAGVSIYASSGVTDGSGRYGYVIYVKEEDHQRAATALGAVTPPHPFPAKPSQHPFEHPAQVYRRSVNQHLRLKQRASLR